MSASRRWIIGIAAACVGVLVIALGGLAWWLPSDAQVAARVATEFEQRTGVALRVGAAHWTLRPGLSLELDELATAQKEPITVRRLVLHASLRELLARRIRVDDVEIEGAVFPRASAREFRGRGDGSPAALGAFTMDPVPVGQVRFDDVTWIDRRGIALAYDGRIEFDPGWMPRRAEVSRRGVTPPARLELTREGEGIDRWRTDIEVAGGTWSGTAAVQALPEGNLRLHADLVPRDVDIVGLTSAFGRKTAVEGRINGRTEVMAEGANPIEWWQVLHTRTRFTVRPALLRGFDLARAVSTAGISRGGQTPLDELAGTLDTQGTENGIVLRYTNLKARSGLLTASGSATMLNRKVDGELAVDIVDGVVGVPLKVGGTLDAPELSLTGGALAGAAIGSAVLPGVGTAIGARIGQRMEQLFGDPSPKGAAKKKKRAAP
ncbi:AsmA-like C-terminal region-containing protein [Variovorax sp. dw_954]|uniref:AsmA-like C-terminal region-containing protein n=1 Tax=Variovorax sp. dw_954 TaxID=2720078 RepID=UPI001BD26049|nr:AsmA-like C-terminal region-containing protein [Variovorax sp. dw_954]